MTKGKIAALIGAVLLCIVGIAVAVSAATGRGGNPLALFTKKTQETGTLPLVIEITRPDAPVSTEALPPETQMPPDTAATLPDVTGEITTAETTTEETTTEEPATEETTTEETTTEETTTEETTTEETTTEESTTEETTAEEATTEEPTTEEPTTEEPTTPEPTTPEPTTPEPTTPEPTTPEPTTPEPTTPEPTTPEPTTPEPTTPEPTTQVQETIPESLRQHLAALNMGEADLVGSQLMVVRGLEKPRCVIYCYEKRDGVWQPVDWLWEIPGITGRDGMNWHTPEEYKYTPIGYFGLGPAYGEAAWEDTGLEYYQIQREDYYVVDPNSKYYNQLWKAGRDELDWQYAEEMIEMLEYYEYCIYVQHNVNPIIPNEGSAIFVHIDRLDNSTSGCIGVEKWVMQALFKWMRADANPHIFLYPAQ